GTWGKPALMLLPSRLRSCRAHRPDRETQVDATISFGKSPYTEQMNTSVYQTPQRRRRRRVRRVSSYLPTVRTKVRMACLICSGKVAQARTTSDKPGSFRSRELGSTMGRSSSGSEGTTEGTELAVDSPKSLLGTSCEDCGPVSKTGVPFYGTVGS